MSMCLFFKGTHFSCHPELINYTASPIRWHLNTMIAKMYTYKVPGTMAIKIKKNKQTNKQKKPTKLKYSDFH